MPRQRSHGEQVAELGWDSRCVWHGAHIPNHWAGGPSVCLHGNFKSLKMNTAGICSVGHLGTRDRAFRRAMVEKPLCLGEMCRRQYIPNCSLKIHYKNCFFSGVFLLGMDRNLTPSSAPGMTSPSRIQLVISSMRFHVRSRQHHQEVFP